jgi:hypothetical protein
MKSRARKGDKDKGSPVEWAKSTTADNQGFRSGEKGNQKWQGRNVGTIRGRR